MHYPPKDIASPFGPDGPHGAPGGLDAPSEDVPVEYARPDLNRERRKGVPEVILAQGKRQEDVVAVAQEFVRRTGRAIVSRVDDGLSDRLRILFPDCSVSS